jgi:hypothetical protein
MQDLDGPIMNVEISWTLLGSEGDWALYIPVLDGFIPHRATMTIRSDGVYIALFNGDGEVGGRRLKLGSDAEEVIEMFSRAHLFNTLVLVSVVSENERHACECVVVNLREAVEE